MADNTDCRESTPTDKKQADGNVSNTVAADSSNPGVDENNVRETKPEQTTIADVDPKVQTSENVNESPPADDEHQGSSSADIASSQKPNSDSAHQIALPVETAMVNTMPSNKQDSIDRKSGRASASSMTSDRKLRRGGRKASRQTPTRQVKSEEDRDPHRINGELTLRFAEIFAEPEASVHSVDCVWQTSERIFSAVKLWSYRILGMLCAVPCACIWAVLFALLSIASIWVWSPWLKMFRVLMLCFKTMLDYVALALLVPLFEAIGRVFSAIRINVNKQTFQEHDFA